VNKLPTLMVAPTGARRTKQDHPALPVSIKEIVAEARACYEAGADGIHLHVRDEQGEHTIDVGLYREALSQLSAEVPDMAVQVTTEAVGRYSPADQRNLVEELKPKLVSISIAEMTADPSESAVINFYQQCAVGGVGVQHILYSPDEVTVLFDWMSRANLLDSELQLLFVLGRYTSGQVSDPALLAEFLSRIHSIPMNPTNIDWGLCAFGQHETSCLKAARQAGGKMRVGFENSLWNHDGSIAANNAERVAEVVLHTALPQRALHSGDRLG